MTQIRRLILAIVLSCGIAPAFAQAPPPVPALPDTERRTTYSITSSTCACAVGFQLYGDSTDYGNWLEVFVNGVLMPASGNWTITTPTGSLATVPRPITNAVLTFAVAQTGTVQIVGARRPRRAAQFSESAGVSARNINQVITDLTAQNREIWDKTNDVTGRTVRAPPGETLAMLPVLASRQNMGACFDNNGNLTSCIAAASGSFAAGSGIVFTGTNPTTISLPPIGAGQVMANATGGSAVPVGTAPSTWFDAAYCSTPARVLLRTTSAWSCNPAIAVDIRWYGARCDGIFWSSENFDPFIPFTLSIASGTPNLVASAAIFTAADVGKSVYVPGAGPAAAGLSTTILAFVNSTQITLATNASTTLAAAVLTNAAPFVYGTDDTLAIQAAMDATPVGGTLFIPGSTTGCLIKRQGANAYVLKQDHPFNIVGQGQNSNLMTDPSIPTTVHNLLVQAGSYSWTNTTWDHFSIGAMSTFFPSTLRSYPRFGAQGMRMDAPGSGFNNITITRVIIGESSAGGYALYINGIATQSLMVGPNNRIHGGVHLDAIADSAKLLNNYLGGFSIFGVLVDAPGAGGFQMRGNNMTMAGGTRIASGLMPIVDGNYFEEASATVSLNNAVVDFDALTSYPQFTNNIVQVLAAPTANLVRFGPSTTGGIIGGNFLSAFSIRTGVISTVQVSCTAPNAWSIAGGTHFSTALANTYAGC